MSFSTAEEVNDFGCLRKGFFGLDMLGSLKGEEESNLRACLDDKDCLFDSTLTDCVCSRVSKGSAWKDLRS